MTTKVKVNRAPVLTLWAAVVAERLGYANETALTLGRVLAGLNAQSKGQRLGIYEPAEERPEREAGEERRTPEKGPDSVRLLGRHIEVEQTEQGLRALDQGQPVDHRSVERYLQQKFKDNLPEVREALAELAASMEPEALERRAFSLYEDFRPEIPEGKRGWGAAGDLDLDKIRGMAAGRKA